MGSSGDLKTIFHNATVSVAKALYLLDVEQEDEGGRSKVRFFISMGFSADDLTKFAESMQTHHMTARLANTLDTEFGKKFVLVCDLNTPSGKSVCVQSIWQMDNGQTVPSLITTYPAN